MLNSLSSGTLNSAYHFPSNIFGSPTAVIIKSNSLQILRLTNKQPKAITCESVRGNSEQYKLSFNKLQQIWTGFCESLKYLQLFHAIKTLANLVEQATHTYREIFKIYLCGRSISTWNFMILSIWCSASIIDGLVLV